jgi:hypothetical protein
VRLSLLAHAIRERSKRLEDWIVLLEQALNSKYRRNGLTMVLSLGIKTWNLDKYPRVMENRTIALNDGNDEHYAGNLETIREEAAEEAREEALQHDMRAQEAMIASSLDAGIGALFSEDGSINGRAMLTRAKELRKAGQLERVSMLEQARRKHGMGGKDKSGEESDAGGDL